MAAINVGWNLYVREGPRLFRWVLGGSVDNTGLPLDASPESRD